MRWQQPVRIVASAPAELYKESCCPAGPADFPRNFHSASAGRGGKSTHTSPLAPRSRARPSCRSSEGQDRPPLHPIAPSPKPGGAEPPPAPPGCREGERLGEVGGPRGGGRRGGGPPGQVQRYVLASRSSPAEPWACGASVPAPRTPGRGAARLRTASASPLHAPALVPADPSPRSEETFPPPRGFIRGGCLARSCPLPNGFQRAAAQPGHFKEIFDPPFLLPLGRPGGQRGWCVAFPVAAGTGSIPEGQRPLRRHQLYCTSPLAARSPPAPPRLRQPRGLKTTDSSRALGTHTSITPVFEVRLGSRSPVGGLWVCRPQPSPASPRLARW